MDKESSKYLKYLTERVVGYIDKPKEERIRLKEEANAQKEQWLIRWFGVGGAYIYYSRRKRNKHQDE